jgi:hypothetical protein
LKLEKKVLIWRSSSFGKDDVIGSICPAYKTDALVRKVNLDRYDDRKIIQTNLVESYDFKYSCSS